ncbi:MAG: Tyrosine-protein kinase Wzc [Noviherbaspirillum sp.]|nr:Tyrosine-protein kinase Wzc [Noviherbaspirillum sp.]
MRHPGYGRLGPPSIDESACPFMNQIVHQLPSERSHDDTLDLAKHLVFVFDNRWLIAGVALVITLLGAAYAFMSKPIYEANILVQIEDGAAGAKTPLADLTTAYDLKAGAASEMEILRSRLVVSRAVDQLKLYIGVQPKYFPLFGAWIARRSENLSEPGLFGFGGYVWGRERAEVSVFNVPAKLQDQPFELIAEGEGRYRLIHEDAQIDIEGREGMTLRAAIGAGLIELRVERLAAKPGARFNLMRSDRLDVIERMQAALKIGERGKQSGIIGVALEDSDPKLATAMVNQIGAEYIYQNEDRKSQEAEKALAFLHRQMPEVKRQLEVSESAYNALRNSRGTIDLNEEAKSALQRAVAAQAKLVDLKQKREELLTRFQEAHPFVTAIDLQIGTLNRELTAVDEKIKKLPALEQDVFRLNRDVKVNTEVYTSLLNAAQQLRMISATKVGNARLLDAAEMPIRPVKPKRGMMVAFSAVLGVALGIGAAFSRKVLRGAVDDPHEITDALGLQVTAAIPHSPSQAPLFARTQSAGNALSLLAHDAPSDSAVESLRGLRASLLFAMRVARNNVILITGPTAEVGKSFISANLAVVLGAVGKKVLLIDGDMRKGYLHRYFGQPRENGLSEAIAGAVDLEQVIRRNTVDNVDFIATGRLPKTSAELLACSHFELLLQRLSARYDFILIDTAPVLVAADALIVAPHAGAVFSIVRAGISTIGEIDETVNRLNRAGATVTGTVFNDMRPRLGRYAYGGGYHMVGAR